MDIARVAIAIVVFIAIQFFATRNLNLISALVANIPFFTIFAFISVRGDVHKMLLSLGVFTLMISLSFFLTYMLAPKGKVESLVIFFGFWSVLTAIAYILLKR